jgi:hypothetical protein
MSTHTKYMGKAQAFKDLGFSPGQIKVAFVAEGLPEDYADTLCKEAFWGMLGAGLKGIGSAAKGFGALAKGSKAAQGVGSAAKGFGAMAKGTRAAQGFGNAGRSLTQGGNAATKWGIQAMRRGGTMGKMQGHAGLLAGRTARSMGQGMRGMQTAPGATMWQGAKNFGSGAMMMQGKGVTGGLGKAMYVNSMLPPMGN